jgi:CRP-like cAMP-binding protein
MSEPGILGTFASHTFLSGLDERHRMLLASGARPFRAAAGDILGHEGETARAFYLIQSGHVTLAARTGGKGSIEVQTVGPGEVIGWSWLVPPHRWQFQAVARDAVAGIAFDGEWLRDQCENDYQLGYLLLKHLVTVLAARLAATRRQLFETRRA